MSHPSYTHKTLQLALLLAFQGSLASTVWAEEAASTMQAIRTYHIPAGELTTALQTLAGEAGLILTFTPEQTAGKQSSLLHGRYSVEQAFDILLTGSGLAAKKNAPNQYSLLKVTAPSPSATRSESKDIDTLPEVMVVDKKDQPASSALQNEGTAAQGYRVKTISSVGALGAMKLQDTPFSMSVVPRELIQNIQAQSPDDIYKVNPFARTTTPQITSWSPATNIRGFTAYNTAEDGLRRPYNHAAVTEDKERVEIMNGPSGFLYGAATPGGMVNFVYKRPTLERLNSVTLGNYGGDQYYVHGDFGGRIDDEGRAGYRLNVVRQDGNTAIDHQKIDRVLVSGAIDWQLTDQLLLELNASYNDYKTQGTSAYWFYDVKHGKAPDASKLWSQPWARDEFENTKLMGKLTYQLNDNITLRGAYMRDYVDRPLVIHTLNNVISNTAYNQIRTFSGRTKDTYDAAQAMADIRFDTGSAQHKLTVGYYMYSDKFYQTPANSNSGWLGPYSLNSPTYVAEPAFNGGSATYYAGYDLNENYLIGDAITLNEQWSALLGVNRSNILSQSFTQSGAKSQADYNKSRNSPSASLIFKPMPWLTTYASYIEGLEMGGRADSSAANPNQIMPPMITKQKEIGAKATVGNILLTSALFEIEKANEYTNSDNIYTQNGRQNHKGIEFSATGRATERLTVVGGLTLLDAKVRKSEFDGNLPMNVAEQHAKIYTEYDLSGALAGLTLTGGVQYTGKQQANDANTDSLPSVVTADIGARYKTMLSNHPLTLRLNINNMFDKNYWLNAYYVGTPRSVAFSANLQF
ncbi:TonB-dependent receptor [Methylophilus sp. 5]|uniref:TonB-dependent receptor n=1 Tax=Methylophilus sp. 5 TaxID=1112274 RepID=UPI0004904C95|nr:TonB-dependent receptor [Methylophilus sp. 5]